MALHARGRREKREQDMGICNCIVAIFQVMIACQSITFISGQGHLYSESEFQSRKLLQDVSLFPKQQAQGVTSEAHDKNFNAASHTIPQIRIIRFEPPFLDFDTECVGMPKLRTVFIHNPSKERDLQLSSISARTSHFHASFFDRKIVPPGGNTSFEVVFLARVVGNVENTLFINTLHGTFPYQVFGIGIPNPYRLRPYLGAKVPINSSFSPLISMHNPTSGPLQVMEMYSSSGYLQLQLPRGQHEGDKEQWEIPPYETREVIRARFMGQVEANHTAFIRIKTSQAEDSNQDFHILPVEVEVSSAPGIYSALELLDFGTLRTDYDEPKTLPLFLLNSGEQEVQISSISMAKPNPAIEIHFKSMKLKPSETMFTLVANVTFSASLAKSPADQKGNIIVKARDKNLQPLEIPFIASLLDGSLAYDLQAVLFHLNETRVRKNIRISNLFKFPIVLQNFSLTEEARSNFKVHNFSGPVLLPVSSRVSPFSIEYDPMDSAKETPENLEEGSLHYLTLQTNISKFFLPLHYYSGLISYKVLREDKEKLDFGVMGTMDKRQVLFALYNHNPAKILLEKINSTLENIEIHLVSLTQDSDKNLTQETDFQLENFWLPSNSCSVFEVTLSASETEEEISTSISIVTKYQEIAIPVLARIVIGTLTVKPEKIKFQRSFPGLVVHQALTVVNTFAQSSKLEYVHSKEIDKRFYYKKWKNQGLNLEPNKKTKIGKVYFDARQSCKPDRCYTGLPTSTTIGHHWLTTLALGPDSVEFDSKRYKEHRQRWRNLKNKGLTGPNTTLVLSADVGNVDVPVQATLYWPSLLEESTFHFPLTHVGRKSIAALTLVNPADTPVVVQVLPLSLYPHPETALHTLQMADKLEDPSFITNNITLFRLVDPRHETMKDSMASQMVWLEYTLNGKLNHTVVNLFLDPGDRVNLRVEFEPYDDNPKSTVILLRNNLTILDVLPMHGRGAYEHLTLGGKAPNLHTSVLRFKLTKDLLKDCTRKKSNPSFTVRKWFHANNTGMLPIHITSMTVSGSPCDGYGFRVLDCDQFILQPNSSKKIEIAYTPDFTSYLVLHELKLITAQGNEMVFTLNVSLPPYMLPLCQEAVPRPSWELTLYYFIVAVMLVLCVGVMLMAYLESVTIWDTFVRMYEIEQQHKLGRKKLHSPDGFGKTFDLKNITSSFMSASSSNIVKAEPIQNGESPFAGKKFSTVTLKPSFKFVGAPDLEGPKHDSSQQTDPHPDFPPLTASIFSRYHPTGILSRLMSFFRRNNESLVSVEAESEPLQQVPTPAEDHVLDSQTGPRFRHNATANNEKRKNDRKFRSLEHFHQSGQKERHSKPTAEIHPVTKSSAISNRKNSVCTIPEKDSKDNGNMIPSKPVTKRKDSSKERQSGSEESINQNVARKKALQRRRSRSKSMSQCSRESTSSSGSLDLPDQDMQPSQTSVNADEPVISKVAQPEAKSETAKPARGKKSRKLTRKQLKALAREKQAMAKGNTEKEEPEKPVTPSDEEKPTFEPRKVGNAKLSRQSKRRSPSPSVEQTPIKVDKKKFEKSVLEEKCSRNPTPPRNETQSKPPPKRRSYSYNADDNKQKEKPNRITIYKRPKDSHSSSSQEISESSSGESTALWETPSRCGDADEDMRQISKQSQNAEKFIAGQQRGKERRRGKGASSPVQLSSGSRSSSYSSIMSTASSNDGVPSKAQNNGPAVTSTPTKKLHRSMSDATGGTLSRTQLRRRSPYPPADPINVSPSHTVQKDMSSVRTTSPQQQPQYAAPTRTVSSPSMFNGKQKNPPLNSQWSYDNQFATSSYSAFGKSNFNLAENLIGKTTTAQSAIVSTWESPFSDNSSLYSTPSPARRRNISPPSSLNMGPLGWNSSNTSPVQSTGYPTFDAPPGTPTTPGPRSHGAGWGEPTVPATTTNMTTHSIWSVSNAVTMDENRNTECDPLGVRSIWSNTQQLQNPNWHDMR